MRYDVDLYRDCTLCVHRDLSADEHPCTHCFGDHPTGGSNFAPRYPPRAIERLRFFQDAAFGGEACEHVHTLADLELYDDDGRLTFGCFYWRSAGCTWRFHIPFTVDELSRDEL